MCLHAFSEYPLKRHARICGEVHTHGRLLPDIRKYRPFVFWRWWKAAQNNEIFCFAAEPIDIDTTSTGATTSDSLPGKTPTLSCWVLLPGRQHLHLQACLFTYLLFHCMEDSVPPHQPFYFPSFYPFLRPCAYFPWVTQAPALSMSPLNHPPPWEKASVNLILSAYFFLASFVFGETITAGSPPDSFCNLS